MPLQVPILTISSTIATWDWTLELIASLTHYDRIGRQQTSLCNYYGFLRVGRHSGTTATVFFGNLVDCGSYGVEGHEVEDMRNDMTFLTVLLARREVITYRLWRNRTKEMFGGVMD